MIIPHEQLSQDALRGVLHEFVTRDGTDLSDAQVALERATRALEKGRVVIVFDEEQGTCTIMKPEEAELLEAQAQRDAEAAAESGAEPEFRQD